MLWEEGHNIGGNDLEFISNSVYQLMEQPGDSESAVRLARYSDRGKKMKGKLDWAKKSRKRKKGDRSKGREGRRSRSRDIRSHPPYLIWCLRGHWGKGTTRQWKEKLAHLYEIVWLESSAWLRDEPRIRTFRYYAYSLFLFQVGWTLSKAKGESRQIFY